MKTFATRLKVIGLAVMLFLAGSVNSVKAQDINYKIASLFIYGFVKYVEWPTSVLNGDFVIGVYGNSPIIEELQSVAQSKKIGGRSIVVKVISNVSEVNDCHLIFVTSKESKGIQHIVAAIKANATLIVTEKAGLIKKGSMINIFHDEDDDKTKFEINKAQLEKSKLKMSHELLRLGIVV